MVLPKWIWDFAVCKVHGLLISFLDTGNSWNDIELCIKSGHYLIHLIISSFISSNSKFNSSVYIFLLQVLLVCIDVSVAWKSRINKMIIIDYVWFCNGVIFCYLIIMLSLQDMYSSDLCLLFIFNFNFEVGLDLFSMYISEQVMQVLI